MEQFTEHKLLHGAAKKLLMIENRASGGLLEFASPEHDDESLEGLGDSIV
jgi:hypothetical protein